MIGEKEKQIKKIGLGITEREKYKILFMEIIKRIDSKQCAVLFIGTRLRSEHIKFVVNNINKFNLMIIAARGGYIPRMTYFYDEVEKLLEKRWGNTAGFRITGVWEFSDRQSDIMWIIAIKTDDFPAIIDFTEF
jgi:hypothetical protein